QANGDKDTLASVEIIDDGASGRILLVGNGGFEHIQDAIDAATNGDTVMIAADTYSENITLRDGVDIVGLDGAVLDGAIITPATLTGVTVKGLDVHNSNMLLDMRNTDSVTDVVFEDMTFSLTGDFSQGGANAQMPFGNGQSVGYMA